MLYNRVSTSENPSTRILFPFLSLFSSFPGSLSSLFLFFLSFLPSFSSFLFSLLSFGQQQLRRAPANQASTQARGPGVAHRCATHQARPAGTSPGQIWLSPGPPAQNHFMDSSYASCLVRGDPVSSTVFSFAHVDL